MKNIKELANNLIKSIANGWKRLGEADVNDSQEVQVNFSPDVQARLGALELVTDYKYMSKEKKPNKPNIEPQQRVDMQNTRTTMPPRQNPNYDGKMPNGRVQSIQPRDGRDTYRDI